MNICGYHAAYNLIETLNLLKSQDISAPYKLNNSADFWQFKFEISNFLWNYAQKKVKNTKTWPWTYNETHFGDFERTFLKVCLAENPRFREAITPNKHF
jgi:hypothetical protein